MKVGILSDTHVPGAANALPPDVFRLFQGVDLILHCGDIVDLALLEELKAIAPVEAVAGNMDDLEAHRVLGVKKVLTLGKFTVGLIHGKFRIDVQKEMIRKEFGNVDLIVYGHSHHAYWGKVGDALFLNPVSPTDSKHAPFHSVAILDVGEELHAEIIRL